MRWVLSLLGLFALAVAVGLALEFNDGYVLLVVPPYRVELSFSLMLLILLLGFGLGYLLLRFVANLASLPRTVREFRAARASERAHAKLIEAVKAYFEGRLGRTERSARDVMESGTSPEIGAILAARAAHGLRQYDRRDHYLDRVIQLAPRETTLHVMLKADMLLEQHRHQEALQQLREMRDKHVAALRLELKALQQAGQWEQVLQVLAQLERRSSHDVFQAHQIRLVAYSEIIKRKAEDGPALEEFWQGVPSQIRVDPKFAAMGAAAFARQGSSSRANQIIELALTTNWDSELVTLYGNSTEPNILSQIEHAEKWLEAHPHDAGLLLVLGKLCERQGLWGKALSYMEASIAIESSSNAHHSLATLLERMGKPDLAKHHVRQGLEIAIRERENKS